MPFVLPKKISNSRSQIFCLTLCCTFYQNTIWFLVKIIVYILSFDTNTWATSDKIRNELTALGIKIKGTKDEFEWNL